MIVDVTLSDFIEIIAEQTIKIHQQEKEITELQHRLELLEATESEKNEDDSQHGS